MCSTTMRSFPFGRRGPRPADRHARWFATCARRALHVNSPQETRWRAARSSTPWRIRPAASGWPPARACCGLKVAGLRASFPGQPLLSARRSLCAKAATAHCGPGPTAKDCGASTAIRRRIYTTADGLSSDQIRSLYQDPDGTLWIATFRRRLERSARWPHRELYTEKDGLLSDNIAKIEDDGESLWLATTRGICRIEKRQLKEFSEGKRQALAAI